MEKLRNARVAVFGLGGVGGYVVEALARSGIGTLDLIDHDTISPTNINRQILATQATIGMDKVTAAAQRVAAIDPAIRAQILGNEKPLEGRYADTLAPIVEPTREKLGDLAKCDEDVLSYIAFPNLAEKFLEERKAKEENVVTYSIVEC